MLEDGAALPARGAAARHRTSSGWKRWRRRSDRRASLGEPKCCSAHEGQQVDDAGGQGRRLAAGRSAPGRSAAGCSAAGCSVAGRSAARCGRGRTRNEGAKGSRARVRARPTPDAPDPTRGANDRTGNGHAASAEHGSACSAPPRAPQHPERSVTAQWPRHPRSKHYTKRNDKSATNGMMRGAGPHLRE